MHRPDEVTQSHQETRRTVCIFAGYYWLVSVAIAAFAPYIGVYFFELGYSATRIGILTSIGPFVAILTQPLWGAFGDRSRQRKRALQTALIGALIASGLYLVHDHFVFVFAVTGLYMAFSQAFRPLHDSMILDYLQNTRYSFAPIRLAGTIGFSLMTLAGGAIIGDRVKTIFPLHAALLALTVIMTCLFPRVANDRRVPRRTGFKKLLSHRFVCFVYTYCFLLYIAFGFHASFLPVYMRDLGMSNADVGLAIGLGALSEIPVLLVIERLIRRYGAPWMLIGAGGLTAVRMLAYGYGTSVAIFAAAQLMQGVTLIAAYYCAVTILNDAVPRNLKSTAHAFLAIIVSGFARIAGSMGGGAIADALGLERNFLISFWIVSVATGAGAVYVRHITQRHDSRYSSARSTGRQTAL